MQAAVPPQTFAQISPAPEAPRLGNINVSPSPPIDTKGDRQGSLFSLENSLAGVGKSLANLGIYANGYYVSTLYSNVSGGSERGTIGIGRAVYGFDFDLEKMANVHGAAIHLQLESHYGGINQGVNNFSGSLLGFVATQGPNNTTRLAEFSYDQHLFDDHLRFVVGRTSLSDFFGTSPLYCQFVIGICQNITPLVWPNNSNLAFQPISTWGGEMEVLPTKHTYLRFGAEEDNPNNYRHSGFPWDAGWSTKNATGVFLPVEIGYATAAEEDRYASRYALGFFHDTSTFYDPRYSTNGSKLAFSGGAQRPLGASEDIYVQAQQIVWRPSVESPRALYVISAASFNITANTNVQSYYQLGMFMRGPFASRPDDSFGLMGTHFMLNHKYTGALNDRIAAQGLSGNVSNTEQILEVNYGVSFAPGMAIKPYAYYTWHPDQLGYETVPKPHIANAVGVGAQLFISLNYAFGLPAFYRPN